jgi:hypothetical protein
MTSTLQRIAGVGTGCRGSITRPHEYWISIVAKVVSACIVALPRSVGVDSRWNRKPESTGWESVWNRFKGENGPAVSQAYHGPDGTTKRVTSEPYLRIRIEFRHIAIEKPASRVVTILLCQALLETRKIAGIRVLGTIANLSREAASLLSTATAKEEVVVLLVVGGGPFAVPNRESGAL